MAQDGYQGRIHASLIWVSGWVSPHGIPAWYTHHRIVFKKNLKEKCSFRKNKINNLIKLNKN